MKYAYAAVLMLVFTSAAAQNKEATCRAQAGEPGNPTYEAMFKRCMGQGPAPTGGKAPAPAAKAPAPAVPAKKMSEAQCRANAGDPGNPTYEAVLKRCLGK
jgi:hypothetical protein